MLHWSALPISCELPPQESRGLAAGPGPIVCMSSDGLQAAGLSTRRRQDQRPVCLVTGIRVVRRGDADVHGLAVQHVLAVRRRLHPSGDGPFQALLAGADILPGPPCRVLGAGNPGAGAAAGSGARPSISSQMPSSCRPLPMMLLMNVLSVCRNSRGPMTRFICPAASYTSQ